MTTFFVICGKGGKSDEGSFLTQPWRIVIPALLFFLVMFCISIINLTLVNKGMDVFCESLTKSIQSINCDDALNAFALIAIDYEPQMFHHILYFINWTIFGLWLFLAAIMFIRIAFVIDFQLVRITVRTCEYEDTNERSAFRVMETTNNSKESGRELTTQF